VKTYIFHIFKMIELIISVESPNRYYPFLAYTRIPIIFVFWLSPPV
jgi:hypothetical protein